VLPKLLSQPVIQYLSTGQGLHDAFDPVPTAEYVPAAQNPLPKDELLPIKQNTPAGHFKHALAVVEPTLELYVPSGQEVQDDDLPVPNVEKLPAGQSPSPSRYAQPRRQYLPALHTLHSMDPFLSE
jgi:hypothetical protein